MPQSLYSTVWSAVGAILSQPSPRSSKSAAFDDDGNALSEYASYKSGALYHSQLNDAITTLTDAVAATVRSALRSFSPASPTKADARILLIGTHALFRARHIAHIRDFPTEIAQFDVADEKVRDHNRGGVFYADSLNMSDTAAEHFANSFDVVLLFHIAHNDLLTILPAVALMTRYHGAVAGTVIATPAPMIGHDGRTADELTVSCETIRALRDAVEAHSLVAQSVTDMSLTQQSTFITVMPDFDDATMSAAVNTPYIYSRINAIKHKTSSRHTVPLAANTVNELSDASKLYNLSVSLSSNLYDLARQQNERHSLVVSGVSIGLPNSLYPDRSVFDINNFNYLFNGDNYIANLTTDDKQNLINQNVCQIRKKDGKRIKYRLSDDKEMIQLASRIGHFSLTKEYPMIPAHVCEVLDTTYELAIAAGLEALRDAGLDVCQTNEDGTVTVTGLPLSMQDETGVIFASSFPCLDSLVQEVTKSAAAKARHQLKRELAMEISENELLNDYEYDRKLLFKLLVMANSQLAELIHARGPNTHINNACSGTTQAIAIAEDWIKAKRCRRVVVIAADNATSDQLLPYLATGFLALGAATTVSSVGEAAVPFDIRRRGMILGAGAVSVVLESHAAANERQWIGKSELMGSLISNSAFHASLMDSQTTSFQLCKFIKDMENTYGIDRADIAEQCIYFAHETCTHSNGGCAKVELDALRAAFGEHAQSILMANTKGFTGHPMGVGIEDAVAVESLYRSMLPPLANHKAADPILQLHHSQLPLSPNGHHNRNYVLRFAAGFGSQFAYVLYRKCTQTQTQTTPQHNAQHSTHHRVMF